MHVSNDGLKLSEMKPLDRYLRNRRIKFVQEFLSPATDVLDIGCADGAMFEQLKGRYRYGYGVEPTLGSEVKTDSYQLFPGVFPDALPSGTRVDLVTLLAVLEHLPPAEQAALANGCHDVLQPGGRIVATVPSHRVDDLLHVLAKLRLVDGMSMHEHYGFDPMDTLRIFSEPRFKVVEHRKFQFGLNNLFVFERA
ncbi:MAG TPA: methyltransferase domain-containing protein [Dehalococcoidia bacterium]|nr:methyltransferase domain-containing protein [Dehalococcoidia bacterium]